MSNSETAANLRTLATDSRMTAHGTHLVELADAIEADDQRLDEWLYIDLPTSFVPTQTPPDEREGQGWHRLLHALPQILVFVPILITWIGLSTASRAYNEMLQSGADLGQRNFLELWQQGFDGIIPEALTFDRVALYTVGAIVLLLIISLWSAMDRRRQEDLADHEDEAFRQRVSSTLLAASRVLGVRRLESPTRFEAHLTNAAAGLADVYADAKKLQASARGAVTASTKASDDLVAAVRGVGAVITNMTSTATELHAIVDELRANEAQLTAAIATTGASAVAITTSVEASTNRIGQMLQAESVRSTEQMSEAMGAFDIALNNTVGQLRETLDELTGALQAGSSSYEAAMDLASRVVGTAERVSASNESVSDLVSSTAGSLPDPGSLRRLTDAMTALSQAASQLQTQMAATATQLDASSRRLEATADRLEREARLHASRVSE